MAGSNPTPGERPHARQGTRHLVGSTLATFAPITHSARRVGEGMLFMQHGAQKAANGSGPASLDRLFRLDARLFGID